LSGGAGSVIHRDLEAEEIAEIFQYENSPTGILARAYLKIVSAPRPLTEIQLNFMYFIIAYIEENGYAPSFEEIAANFCYTSLATVHEHLSNLERKGWIRRGYNESRAITVLHMPQEVTA
jgi:hypothetical protein